MDGNEFLKSIGTWSIAVFLVRVTIAAVIAAAPVALLAFVLVILTGR